MQLLGPKNTSITFFAWTGRLIESTDRLILGLREEFQAIHFQEQDRAFLATTKGMSYVPLEDGICGRGSGFAQSAGSTTH